ncbi:DNA alkylation repair protein [Paenibacillus eucommiae]|uniref:3-methyladenine DNA glycosylase AlkD n=1 Tax=Paenibacillus eucommiae TaxID=1355755 RepID=A0ABS4IVC1_9BACL|nr:DNA alkylation repair protein [Paenibacillus eucommiae]MBP1991537.1 3-methyladenine DNA glycosylase AlkD [Paenibacillus eucommiae]
MTVEEVLGKLEAMGSEQTKKTFIRHGAPEPLFGVKIGDMKKLVKYVKKDQDLVLALYDTGNYDAMYLAGMSINPKMMTKEKLRDWANQSKWHAVSEYTVARAAAESNFALELAREWMASKEECIALSGWNTYANYVSITADEQLDMDEIRRLLRQVEQTIHEERNFVRYAMNNFVICVGTFVVALHEEAMQIAESIGKVHVNMGQTACKVPLAAEYVNKVKTMGRIGLKKKTCIC